MPITVIGINILDVRCRHFVNKYKSNVTPSTQPTCGRALKTKIIDIRNPAAAKSDRLLLSWEIKNRRMKQERTQKEVALSLSPKTDHAKLLGRKVKTKKRLKKIRGLCLMNSETCGRLEAVCRITAVVTQIIKNP